MNHPMVSIITVNFRNEDITCELLESLGKLSYKEVEVIVVDNGMQYESRTKFEKAYPGVITIGSTENLGFACGNNLGIEAAKGDYIMLLNNDTEVPSNTIEKILSHFDSDKIAAVSPVIRYYDNPGLIQYAGFTKINPILGRNRMIRDYNTSKTNYTSPYFHGAAVMIKKTAIDQVGKMPEHYFLYYEEIDWSNAFTKNGFEIRVANDISVLHKESVSTGKKSPLKAYFHNRNRLLFMLRNHTLCTFCIFLSFYATMIFPKEILRYTLKKEPRHIKAIFLGIQDFFLGKMRLSIN